MNKLQNIFLFLIVSWCFSSCEVSDNPYKLYKVTYQGQELSANETKVFFESELERFDNLTLKNNTINLVDKLPPINKSNSKKENSFSFKNNELTIHELQELNEADFRAYYNTLNDDRKFSLCRSKFMAEDFKIVQKNKSLQTFIIEEFNRFEKEYSSNNNLIHIHKLEFKISLGYSDLTEEFKKHFKNADENIDGFINSNLIYHLSKQDEVLALDYFIQLLRLKNKKVLINDKFYDLIIGIDERNLLTKFILSKDKEVKNKFIDIFIETLKLDVYSIEISNWLSVMWNSHKLSDLHKETIIEVLKKSKDYRLKGIGKKYNIHYLGINYLDTIDVKKDSINLYSLFPISKNQLTLEQKNKFVAFLEKEEASFKKIMGYKYNYSKHLIDNNLNSVTSLDVYLNEMANLGYSRNKTVDPDSLRTVLLNANYDRSILNYEFPKEFLNQHVIPLFTSFILFKGNQRYHNFSYNEIMQKFTDDLKTYCNLDLEISEKIEFANNDKLISTHEIYINSTSNGKIYKIDVKDSERFNKISEVIKILNTILKENDKEKRVISIKTEGSWLRYILIKPAAFLILDEKITLNES